MNVVAKYGFLSLSNTIWYMYIRIATGVSKIEANQMYKDDYQNGQQNQSSGILFVIAICW